MPVYARLCRGQPEPVRPSIASMARKIIDRDGATPVYRQVANILRARIVSGELPPNRPVPSETQIEAEFDIARATARKAIAVLRDEGLVETVPGRGSYVTPVE
jgi:GntR family transcriptional regulator